jgi:hypothetical protein
MGDIASWQRANNKKTSPLEQAPAQHNAKIYGTPPGASMNPKIAKPTHPANVCGHGGMSMKKTPVMLADGGDVQEAADKAAGLEASKNDSVGLFERLRMGNIDDPNSEAYRRLGAGRGQAERMKSMPDESEAETRRLTSSAPVVDEPKVEAKEPMTAGDFQRMDKDTTPVATPARPARVAPRTESKKASAPAADYDESDRLKKRVPGPRSVVMKPAARGAEFDPDRIDNFGPRPEPVAPTVRRHPRTGRPY